MTFQLHGNERTIKKAFTVNGAGDSLTNPILRGIGTSINARISDAEMKLRGFVGVQSPAQTEFTLTQDSTDSLLFSHKEAAGSGIYAGIPSKGYIRIEANVANEVFNDYEREFFMAPLPADALQILTKTGAWVSVGSGSTTPNATSHCPVRFFQSWLDEFAVKRFGGVQFVSVFDDGSDEDSLDDFWVVRQIQRPIQDFRRVLLIRHTSGIVENHNVRFRFRSEKDSSFFVDLAAVFQTVACLGFLVKL